MSTSDTALPLELRLALPDGVEADDLRFSIYDGWENLLPGWERRALAGSEIKLSPGLYTVRWEYAGNLYERVVRLPQPQPLDINLERQTPAPVPGALDTREYYSNMNRTVSWDEKTGDPLGGPSRLHLLLRARNRESYRGEDLAEGLRILDENLHPLFKLRERSRLDANFGWLLCSLPAQAGRCFLEYQGEPPRLFPIHLFAGWQTRLFLFYEGGQPNFASASLSLVGLDYDDTRPEAREEHYRVNAALDLALSGLQNNRLEMPREIERTLLKGKFDNPMLGLLGAYYLLQRRTDTRAQERHDQNLAEMVLRNLDYLIPGSPDVAALRFKAAQRFDFPPPDKPVGKLPLLRDSLEALLEADSESVEAIASGSLLEALSPELYFDSPWATFRPLQLRQDEIVWRVGSKNIPFDISGGDEPDAPSEEDWLVSSIRDVLQLTSRQGRREPDWKKLAASLHIPYRRIFQLQREIDMRAIKSSLSQKLAAQAQVIIATRSSQQITAILLTIQSMKLMPTSEGAQVLLNNNIAARPILRMHHDVGVSSVAISPDGKYVASGSRDHTARIWDAFTGEEVARMTHDYPTWRVIFSPDGKYVVSGSKDKTARVWEAATGREVARMTHADAVYDVAFSPDGKYVASVSWDGMIIVWEAFTGDEVARMTHNYPTWRVIFSPDGKYVASGSGDHTARIWDAFTGEEVARMTHDASDVNAVVFSPDGKYVVSGSQDGTVRVWDPITGKEFIRMTHDAVVVSVAFSPDGKYVASGSEDHTARIWDVNTGREVARMTHLWTVHSVAFSPDGKYVVSGSGDGTVITWKVSTVKDITRMPHEGYVFSAAFSSDGKYVITGSVSDTYDSTAHIWDAATGDEIARMTKDEAVYDIAYSPDTPSNTGGKRVISGSVDGTARVWEAAAGKKIARLMEKDGMACYVAFSPDGKHVASGSRNDGTARVWEIATGHEVARITHADAVYDVAFSPDGKYVASVSWDGMIIVWEALTGDEVARMTHNAPTWRVIFSPDGKYVASGSRDHTARIWDAFTGEEVARMTHDAGDVYAVVFSPDGKYVVSGSDDKIARVWEAATGREVARMIHDADAVYDVAFKPDGMPEEVYDVDFSPDGKYVVSGCSDGITRVWEVATRKEVARMLHDGGGSFSPDGKYVVSKSGNTAHIWMWRPEDLIASASAVMPRNLTRAEWQQYIGDALPYQAVCPNLPIELGPPAIPTP